MYIYHYLNLFRLSFHFWHVNADLVRPQFISSAASIANWRQEKSMFSFSKPRARTRPVWYWTDAFRQSTSVHRHFLASASGRQKTNSQNRKQRLRLPPKDSTSCGECSRNCHTGVHLDFSNMQYSTTGGFRWFGSRYERRKMLLGFCFREFGSVLGSWCLLKFF